MRKFYFYSPRGKMTILEVELRLVTRMEDPAIGWTLKDGEWMGIVLKPVSLHEKMPDGSLVAPVWCWHAFYDSLEQAQEQAAKMIRHSCEFELRKYDTPFTEDDITAKIAKIEVIMLP